MLVRSSLGDDERVDGRRDTFQDCRPAATHAFEGFLSQGRVKVKTRVLEVQTRAIVFRLKPPRDRRIERAGCEIWDQKGSSKLMASRRGLLLRSGLRLAPPPVVDGLARLDLVRSDLDRTDPIFD
jgi:hypothetical protein